MGSSITPLSTLALADDQISCDISGDVVILSLRNGVYYGLNAVAAAVWEMLAEPRSFLQLRDGLLERYDVACEQCEHDLLALVEELLRNELVRVVDDGQP